MIRSLRVRFFLIVWPLVVGSVVGVGWYFGNWTRVEVRREAWVNVDSDKSDGLADVVHRVQDAMGAAPDWSAFARALQRDEPPPTERDMTVLVADGAGEIMAASETDLDLTDASINDDGMLTASVRSSTTVGEHEALVRLGGFTIEDSEVPSWAEPPVRVYLLPKLGERSRTETLAREAGTFGETLEATPDLGSQFVAAADRAIILSVLIASVLAAFATLWLARLVLEPSVQLAHAARRIRAGDLSARVKRVSNDELGEVAIAFNDMGEQLERSERLKRRMISDAAHELRTPLTNVIGAIEAIEDGLAEPTPEQIRSIGEEAALLQRIVEDLQEISIADAGGLKLEREPTDLRREADTAAAGFRAFAAERDVTIEVSGEGEAHADRFRIGQVLRNLLHNAVTHAKDGGKVTVDVGSRGPGTLSVRDDGPGIAPEHINLVWERFYRVEGSRDRDSGGTGLGLAVVKRLVEAHGGSAHVESIRGRGAEFWIRLPVS